MHCAWMQDKTTLFLHISLKIQNVTHTPSLLSIYTEGSTSLKRLANEWWRLVWHRCINIVLVRQSPGWITGKSSGSKLFTTHWLQLSVSVDMVRVTVSWPHWQCSLQETHWQQLCPSGGGGGVQNRFRVGRQLGRGGGETATPSIPAWPRVVLCSIQWPGP